MSTQPISFSKDHSSSASQDYPMGSASIGSYNGSNGSFNPASYARHYLGSPLSWQPASSFGGRIFASGSPTAQLLVSSFEARNVKMASSVESDRESLMNALNVFDRDSELCRNYTCCGLHLTDLHALLEHFEEVHIIANAAAAPHISVPFNPQPGPQQQQQPQSYFPQSQQQQQQAYPTPFDPDDMDLDSTPAPSESSSPRSGSGGSTPPDTPVSTPLDPYGQYSYSNPYSSPPSPAPFTGKMHTSFYGFPSAPASGTQAHDGMRSSDTAAGASCVPPALLFSANPPSAAPTSSTEQKPASAPSTPTASAATIPPPTVPRPVVRANAQTTPPGGEASTSSVKANSVANVLSTISSKPFKCPKPNCNKSYKQANGLKYHMTHGSCNFAPAKEVEHVKDLLLERRKQQQQQQGGNGNVQLSTSPSLEGLTEDDLLSLSREAEKRLRPFACGVGDCQRRYKNMNGLRYHYQHSGDHGAIGLRMLASGVHDCLSQNGSGRRSAHASAASTRAGTPQASGGMHVQTANAMQTSGGLPSPGGLAQGANGMVATQVFSPQHTPNSSAFSQTFANAPYLGYNAQAQSQPMYAQQQPQQWTMQQ
ncbi:hypothetical protein HDZ31DRAFT_65476 [Schizophyllum fasciatum]